MDGVEILVIAPPGQPFARRRDRQPDHVRNRSGRRVLAGNPLGIQEDERSRLGRDHQVGVQELSGSLRGIQLQGDEFVRTGCECEPSKGGDGEERTDQSVHARFLGWRLREGGARSFWGGRRGDAREKGQGAD